MTKIGSLAALAYFLDHSIYCSCQFESAFKSTKVCTRDDHIKHAHNESFSYWETSPQDPQTTRALHLDLTGNFYLLWYLMHLPLCAVATFP